MTGRAIYDGAGPAPFDQRRSDLSARARRLRRVAPLACGLLLACSDALTFPRGLSCDLDPELMFSSVGPDFIPALTRPGAVAPDDPMVDYLLDSDRVLGVYIDGEARAYPHNVLWHHEIVNDQVGNTAIAVTFCPLTGSGLAFAAEIGSRELDLGVSGLLYANNLVLYDRTGGDVYGPQLVVEGACGAFRGQSLALLAVQEMSWGRWKALHPTTTVVAGDPAFGGYTSYPYGTYDEITSNALLMPMSVDRSRLIKERVLAIKDGSGGRGFPFGELAELGDVAAVNETIGGVPTAIFYDAAEGETALAFDARARGQVLSFDADPAGGWVDRETGSRWTIDGSAISGPMVGERLTTRADAYTLFWFAWRHFQPDGRTYLVD